MNRGFRRRLYRLFAGAVRPGAAAVEAADDREQREKMVLFLPIEYANLHLDEDGFLFAVSQSVSEKNRSSGSTARVRTS